MYTIRLLNAANVVVTEEEVEEDDMVDAVDLLQAEMTKGWSIEIVKLGD